MSGWFTATPRAGAGSASQLAAQVIVIAKEPVPGRVKTRLTPPFTPHAAAFLAQAALADTLAAVAATPVTRHVLALDLRDRRFGYPLEMVLRAAAAGWRIHEAPVRYYPRTGKSKVTGTVGGTVKAVRDMRRILASCAA